MNVSIMIKAVVVLLFVNTAFISTAQSFTIGLSGGIMKAVEFEALEDANYFESALIPTVGLQVRFEPKSWRPADRQVALSLAVNGFRQPLNIVDRDGLRTGPVAIGQPNTFVIETNHALISTAFEMPLVQLSFGQDKLLTPTLSIRGGLGFSVELGDAIEAPDVDLLNIQGYSIIREKRVRYENQQGHIPNPFASLALELDGGKMNIFNNPLRVGIRAQLHPFATEYHQIIVFGRDQRIIEEPGVNRSSAQAYVMLGL